MAQSTISIEETKKREDVERLKAGWKNDPCFDLYNIEGFEEFWDELREYQEHCEAAWKQEWLEQLKIKAEELGCTGNLKLAIYVTRLESRLEKMEERLAKFER